MTTFFEDFKQSMKKRPRVPVSVVEKHFNKLFFLVDIDCTYIQAVVPMVRWLRPLGNEINVGEASVAIVSLLADDVDTKATSFGNCAMTKSKISMDFKNSLIIRKKNKIVKNLEEKFGEGEKGNEEEGNDDEEEEDVPAQAPLTITQVQGEDQEEEMEIEEGVKGEEANEATISTKKKKRKDKAPLVRKPKKVAKPKPSIQATRTNTKATAKKAQEVEKTKEKRARSTNKEEEFEKRLRRNYIASDESDNEDKIL